MRSFNEYRANFSAFYQAVKKAHQEAPIKNGAHGLDHDVTVAMLGVSIASDQRTADMVWIAAMLHSIDRQFGRWNSQAEKAAIDSKIDDLRNSLVRLLPEDYFKPSELILICEAAKRHSEMNQDDQSLIQIVLMDADRLANLMMSVVIRAAQHQAHRPALELQYLDGMNPDSTYNEPMSALDDLRWCVKDYLPQMRIPAAKQLAETYAKRLEAFMVEIRDDYMDLGLAGVVL